MFSELKSQVVLIAGIPTVNERVYPLHVLENAAKNFKAMFGTLGCPEDRSGLICLADVSHEITGLRMEGFALVVDIKVLPTPEGKILQLLLDAEIPMRFMPLGAGFVERNIVQDDYELYSVYAVRASECD